MKINGDISGAHCSSYGFSFIFIMSSNNGSLDEKVGITSKMSVMGTVVRYIERSSRGLVQSKHDFSLCLIL